MPNPPITVGELTDVPAPESPINAQFHQEVANRIVHRFASVAAMNGWAAGNGSLAFVAPDHYRRVGGAWLLLADQADVDALINADANLQAQIDALKFPRWTTGTYAVGAGHTPGALVVINLGVNRITAEAVLAYTALWYPNDQDPAIAAIRYPAQVDHINVGVSSGNVMGMAVYANPNTYIAWSFLYDPWGNH